MSARGNGITEKTFEFFEQLAEHNDREWFTAHRDVYDQYVDEPFVGVLEEVSARLADTDAPLRGGAATTFRINRDVRFSADKSPYATSRSGLLTPSGTKAEDGGLAYLRLGADGGMVAAGLYQPATKRLDPLRQQMVEEPEVFAEVVDALTEAGLGLDRSDAVKTMPRGYAEHAEHPHAEHLRLRQLVVFTPLPRSTWLDDTVVDRVADVVLGAAPLLRFVSQR